MKTTDTRAFANQLLVCLLVTISCGGSVGLGAVWLRHQISVTANANRGLRERIGGLQRQIDARTVLIETEAAPDKLRERNAQLGLGLQPIGETQIHHINENPVQRLAARNHRDIFRDERQRVTVQLTPGP